MIFKVPSNPSHSMILLCDSVLLGVWERLEPTTKRNLLASDLKNPYKIYSVLSASKNGYLGGFYAYCIHYMPVIGSAL